MNSQLWNRFWDISLVNSQLWNRFWDISLVNSQLWNRNYEEWKPTDCTYRLCREFVHQLINLYLMYIFYSSTYLHSHLFII